MDRAVDEADGLLGPSGGCWAWVRGVGKHLFSVHNKEKLKSSRWGGLARTRGGQPTATGSLRDPDGTSR